MADASGDPQGWSPYISVVCTNTLFGSHICCTSAVRCVFAGHAKSCLIDKGLLLRTLASVGVSIEDEAFHALTGSVVEFADGPRTIFAFQPRTCKARTVAQDYRGFRTQTRSFALEGFHT